MDIPKNWPEDVKEAAKHPLNHLGKYIKISKVGEGGMATVFKAWDKELARYVALKFLKAEREKNIKRFLREARVIAKLDHPNVAQIYEIGSYLDRTQNKKVYFISMRYIEGTTIDNAKLSRRVILKLIHDAALAIHHVHSYRIIHRDIKPSNMMVIKEKDDWHVFVTDFGLAKSTKETTTDITTTGYIVGTPVFMSPEQVKGEKLDARSDVYSLGVTLYYLLSGQFPFTGSNTYEILMKVANEEPPPLSKVARVAPELEIICHKAMEKDKKLRYRSAKEFADDIQRHLEGRPILAKRPSFRAIRKTIKKHPIIIAGAAFGIIVAILILLLILKPPQQQPEKIKPVNREAIGGVKEEKNKIYKNATTAEKEGKKWDALFWYREYLKCEPENKYIKEKIKDLIPKLLGEVKGEIEKVEKLDETNSKLDTIIKASTDIEEPNELAYFLRARASYLKYYLKMDEKYLKEAKQIGEKISRDSDYYPIFKADMEFTIKNREALLRDVMRILLIEDPKKEPFRFSEFKEEAEQFSSNLERFKNLSLRSVEADDTYKVYGSGLHFYFIGEKEKAKERFKKCASDLEFIAEPWLMLAEILLEEKNYEECIKKLRKYLEIRKNDNTVKTLLAFVYLINDQREDGLNILEKLRNKAIFYYAKGMRDKSIEDLRRALDLDRSFAEAHCGLGVLYKQEQNIKDAEKCFQEATNQSRDFPEPYYYLGCIYFEKDNYDQADKYLDKAFKLGMQTPSLCRKRAEIYIKKEQFQQAIDQLSLIKDDYAEPEDFIKLGELYLKIDNIDKAFQNFDKALKKEPENIKALRLRAQVYVKSAEDLDKYLKSLGDWIPVDYMIMITENKKRLLMGAYVDLSKISKKQQNPDIHVKMASICIQLEEYSKAEDHLTEAINLTEAIDPKSSASLYLRRGIVKCLDNRSSYAIKDFDKAIEKDDKLADAHYWRGKANEQNGNLKDAYEDYKKARDLKPDHVDALLALANCYRKEKNFPEAEKACMEAISRNEEYAPARILLATVYEEQGLLENAIEQLKRAMQARMQAPEHTETQLGLHLLTLYLKSARADDAIKTCSELITIWQRGEAKIIKMLILLAKIIQIIAPAKGEEMIRSIDTLQRTSLLMLYKVRASIYGSIAKIDEAIQDYTCIIDEVKKIKEEKLVLFATLCNRGELYLKKQEYDDAIKDFEQAMEINPMDVRPYLLMARAYARKGNYDTAHGICQDASEIAPDNAEVYVEWGDVFQEEKVYPDALKKYEEAEKKDKNCARIYLSRAKLYKKKIEEGLPDAEKHKQDIEKELEKIKDLKAPPEIKVEANLWLAEIYKGRRYYGEALKLLAEAEELEPLNIRIYLLRAEIYERRGRRGDREQALNNYEKAKRLPLSEEKYKEIEEAIKKLKR